MQGLIDNMFGNSMLPHGYCYLWNDQLVYLHALSDGLIVLAYYSISVALIYFVKQREDLHFNYIFVMFAAFIFACGTTHLIDVYNIWNGAYWVSGYAKAVTALVSVATAIAVFFLMPKALAFPSSDQLVAINARLESESRLNYEQRHQLETLSQDLEALVAARTRELEEVMVLKRELEHKNLDLQHSNEALEQFGRIAAHDLKEPAHSVRMIGQLLGESAADKLNAEEREWLDHLVRGSQRMGELVDDLHAYSTMKYRADRMQPVELDAVLDAALQNLDLKIRDQGVELVRHPLPVVNGIRIHLQQLIHNLIHNAIKFSRGSQPPIVELGSVDDAPAGMAGFYVRDNGIGIAEQYHDKIFEIFTRLHSEGEFEGTGMGLAICKKVVDEHHGRIELHSEPGKGAEFRIYLPRGRGVD